MLSSLPSVSVVLLLSPTALPNLEVPFLSVTLHRLRRSYLFLALLASLLSIPTTFATPLGTHCIRSRTIVPHNSNVCHVRAPGALSQHVLQQAHRASHHLRLEGSQPPQPQAPPRLHPSRGLRPPHRPPPQRALRLSASALITSINARHLRDASDLLMIPTRPPRLSTMDTPMLMLPTHGHCTCRHSRCRALCLMMFF